MFLYQTRMTPPFRVSEKVALSGYKEKEKEPVRFMKLKEQQPTEKQKS